MLHVLSSTCGTRGTRGTRGTSLAGTRFLGDCRPLVTSRNLRRWRCLLSNPRSIGGRRFHWFPGIGRCRVILFQHIRPLAGAHGNLRKRDLLGGHCVFDNVSFLHNFQPGWPYGWHVAAVFHEDGALQGHIVLAEQREPQRHSVPGLAPVQ